MKSKSLYQMAEPTVPCTSILGSLFLQLTKSFGVVFFGLAIILLDVLGDDETGISELPNIGNVVVLGQVNAESRTYHEGEAALYYSHLISPTNTFLLPKFSSQHKTKN
uniref:Uncharacterized protein n=1 Tax=Noccaea caerulescens TaxID=107243 RepID=A0A1J3CUH7_NOCCA